MRYYVPLSNDAPGLDPNRSANCALLYLRGCEACLHKAGGDVEGGCYQHSRTTKDLEAQIVAVHPADKRATNWGTRQGTKTRDKKGRTGSDTNLVSVVC